MAKNKLDFFIESIKTLKKSGTLTQSGPALCKAMTDHITHDHKIIVELGAGDGAITSYILKKMAPDAVLYSFEINDTHFVKLLEFEDSRLQPRCESAEEIIEILAAEGIKHVDTIVSAIPFMVLPTEISLDIIEKSHQILKKGHLFCQFHYSQGLKNLYKATFKEITSEFVLVNVPPAVVFRCKK